MKSILRNSPSTLAEAFDSGVRRIDSQPTSWRDIAYRAIAWVTHARRRLSVPELAHALANDCGSAEFDEEDVTDIRLILQACCGFVVVQKGSGDVTMIHTSAHQYFENISPADIQNSIAETCLAYLSCPPFTEGPCISYDDMLRRMQHRPFGPYAAKFWSSHIADENSETGLLTAIRKLLRDQKLRLSSFQASQYRPEITDSDLAREAFVTIPTMQTGLHVAAYWGLDLVTQELLFAGEDLCARDSQDWTPLHWACSKSNLKIIKRLISAGTDLNAKDSEGWTPLFWLVLQGNLDGVELLLARGADHLLTSNRGWGALTWAFAAEQEAIVKTLVNHHRALLAKHHLMPTQSTNTVVKHRSPEGIASTRKPIDDFGLYDLVAEDDMDRVRLWSIPTYDMHTSNAWRTISKAEWSYHRETEDSQYKVPWSRGTGPWKSRLLHGAVRDGSLMALRALLETGADVNYSVKGRTPLHAAAQREDPKFVESLVTRGADVSARDQWDQTPLHRAIISGFEATTAALLSAGSDPNAVLKDPRRITFYKAMRKGTSVSALMLACGLNPTGEMGLTQPNMCGEWDHVRKKERREAAQKKEMREAAQDNKRREAAQKKVWPEAAMAPSRIISLLLAHRADVSWKDEDGVTALHWAVAYSGLDVIKELVNGGADLQAVDNDGQTALDLAVHQDLSEETEYLKSKSAVTGAILIPGADGRDSEVGILVHERGAGRIHKRRTNDGVNYLFQSAPGHTDIGVPKTKVTDLSPMPNVNIKKNRAKTEIHKKNRCIIF